MILDAVYLISLLVFLIRGYSKGLVVALFSVAAVVLGAVGALKLSGTVADQLFEGGAKGGRWAPLLSYLLVFVLIVWLVRLGARLVQRSLETVAMGWANRLAGALLYGFLISFVFSSLLWLLGRMYLIRPETAADSFSYRWLEPLAPRVFAAIGVLLPFAKDIFENLGAFFDTVNQHIPAHVGAH